MSQEQFKVGDTVDLKNDSIVDAIVLQVGDDQCQIEFWRGDKKFRENYPAAALKKSGTVELMD